MRIDKLYIKDFKNLREFNIDFDEHSTTTVLVGRNGTGKSNLLEAITRIFRDLDLSKSPDFAYKIEYFCRDIKVIVDADPNRTSSKYIFKADNVYVSSRRFFENRHQYLPRFVFGYYSGPSNRLEHLFYDHERKYSDELINYSIINDNSLNIQFQSLFFAKLIHSQFVLLAFFIEDDKITLEFLRDELRIEGFDSALFVMKRPYWSKSSPDLRFWGAKGKVAEFLDKLYGKSLAPLRINQEIKLNYRRKTNIEHLYLYLKDLATFRELTDKYLDAHDLFNALESTHLSDLIKEVRIRVKTRNMEGSLTFRELSEGEQQLLMVLGLLKFTKEKESLFLLDEPDTHLNPAWSLYYLKYLKDIVGNQDNSHILMATHDPLTIAGLTKSMVQIFSKDEQTGRITVSMPSEDPKGMGVEGLLTSELYGLSSGLDLDTLQKLTRKRELSFKLEKNELTEAEKLELTKLSDELAGMGFARTIRDPLYAKFVKAYMEHDDYKKPVLSHVEIKEQEELANRIISEILQKDAK